MEFAEEPEDEGEDDADNDAGGEREVDGGVLSAEGEVAGEASERQAGAAEEKDDDSGGEDEKSEADKETAEVIHVSSLASRAEGAAGEPRRDQGSCPDRAATVVLGRAG